jgi:glycerophosphoryl diester phosphodiesterase
MMDTRNLARAIAVAAGLCTGVNAGPVGTVADSLEASQGKRVEDDSIQLGPRPFRLVEEMGDSELKERLLRCREGPFHRTDFPIAHRGAPLQFPEHSDVSYRAAARMGAGIVECDVTFTKDGELVCRHSECDLHTTTNIVATPLNAKCTVPRTGPAPELRRADATEAAGLAHLRSPDVGAAGGERRRCSRSLGLCQ